MDNNCGYKIWIKNVDNFVGNNIVSHSMLLIFIKQIKTFKGTNISPYNVLMLAVKGPIHKKTCMDACFSMSCSFFRDKSLRSSFIIKIIICYD